ncbi:MAG: HDOD domain-containing protein [Acidobacteria bacterium]|nr:HDOD domain-containing protein [Acidobacteriota bacterium]MDA1235338.1 HDOD domain-containing protein [Acidobacteriota bacterium]
MALPQSTASSTSQPPANAVAQPWAIKNLPPFPAVALQLMGLLDSDVPVKDVVKLLRMDPALSAEILRVSNSPLYGLSRHVDSVSHAVVVLGGDAVKRLALTVALGRFTQNFMKHKGLRRCWDHSVACALIAEDLAEFAGQTKDRAYTAGLLHDVGRLALLACYPDEYENLLAVASENDFDFRTTEKKLFEIDHCSAGHWLSKSWNLPPDMTEAIASHHEAGLARGSLASLIAVSDSLAAALGYGTVEFKTETQLSDVIAPLGVGDPDAVLKKVEALSGRISEALAVISSRR